MKNKLLFVFPLVCLLLTGYNKRFNDDHPILAIGSPAPDFHLKGVDGKIYSLSSFKDANILVIVFTCNHCPTAQAYEDRIKQLVSDYKDKGVDIVAIMPNDPKSLRLDELDFSDLGDSYDEMKIRAKEKNFNFPYLYDGDTETASKAYGPIATPHVFIFDKERKLRYAGRVDDTESPFKTPKTPDTRNAIEALLKNEEVPVKTTKVFGCSIKWSEKEKTVEESLEKWAKEPVNLESLSTGGLQTIITNPSQKLYLINIWSANCTVCKKMFSNFITVNRMYRDRDFELISIHAEASVSKNEVLAFLQHEHASNKNYFIDADKRRLIQTVNPAWEGKLPYTLLIEPGGKIVYSKQGRIDPAELKKIIVEDHLIGRYP